MCNRVCDARARVPVSVYYIYNGMNVTVQFYFFLFVVLFLFVVFLFCADHVNWAEVLKLFCCACTCSFASRAITYGLRARVCVCARPMYEW